MDALYRGPLFVRKGCVLIGRPGDYSVAIWPKDFTADHDEAGRLVVRDQRGDVVAIEGEAFEMGGGYVAEFRPESMVEPRDDQISTVERSLGYSFPERCLDGEVYGVWSVGENPPPCLSHVRDRPRSASRPKRAGGSEGTMNEDELIGLLRERQNNGRTGYLTFGDLVAMVPRGSDG